MGSTYMATVFVIDRQSDLALDLSDLGDAIDALLHLHRARATELFVHFVENVEMCTLHGQYFDDNSPTDCICFPLEDRGKVLGDIFICPRTALHFAQKHQLDPHIEVMRYLAHTLLHFLGFEDSSEAQCEVMRGEETRALDLFARRNFSLASR